jgi:phage shock protein C
MPTRERTRFRADESDATDYSDSLHTFPDVSDADIEEFLSDQEEEPKPGFLNLPTVAGLSIITVGTAYLFQELGLAPFIINPEFASLLPWLAGILIILLGFGVLSWSPSKRKQRKRAEKRAREAARVQAKAARSDSRTAKTAKRRLTKSVTNKKVSGVAGGIAEYFGLDPTIIRIAFVVATIFGSGSPILLYLALSFIMPQGEPPSTRPPSAPYDGDRIRIIPGE